MLNSKNTIIMGKKERKRQEIILQALAMHYFLLCHEDVIEIFTTKLMLHANTKIRLRIVLILTPHKQKSTQVSGSFSLPGSFSLVSFIKLLQTKPTKKCQLYISGRDHITQQKIRLHKHYSTLKRCQSCGTVFVYHIVVTYDTTTHNNKDINCSSAVMALILFQKGRGVPFTLLARVRCCCTIFILFSATFIKGLTHIESYYRRSQL